MQFAGRLVKAEIKAGRLLPISQCKCVDCGKDAKAYEHRDYTKPIDVVPVCAAWLDGKRERQRLNSVDARLGRMPLPDLGDG